MQTNNEIFYELSIERIRGKFYILLRCFTFFGYFRKIYKYVWKALRNKFQCMVRRNYQ